MAKTTKGKDRRETIKLLVEHLVGEMQRDETGTLLRSLLNQGFLGFARMSDARLTMELQLYGLEPDFRDEQPDDDDDWETPDDDDVFDHMSSWQTIPRESGALS
jgi:hypothetical protein